MDDFQLLLFNILFIFMQLVFSMKTFSKKTMQEMLRADYTQGVSSESMVKKILPYEALKGLRMTKFANKKWTILS